MVIGANGANAEEGSKPRAAARPILARLFRRYFKRNVQQLRAYCISTYTFDLRRLSSLYWDLQIVEHRTLPTLKDGWVVKRSARILLWSPASNGLHVIGASSPVPMRGKWSLPQAGLQILEHAERLANKLGSQWPLSVAVLLQQMREAAVPRGRISRSARNQVEATHGTSK